MREALSGYPESATLAGVVADPRRTLLSVGDPRDPSSRPAYRTQFRFV